MRIVHVRMRVLHRPVRVRMFVAFAQVQPDAERHQRGGGPEVHAMFPAPIANAIATPNSGATEK